MSGNTFASEAGGLRRKSDAELPTTLHRCDILKEAVLPAGAMTWRWAPPTRYTHRHIAVSSMKDLISFGSIYSDGNESA